jgi:hypothetical protein
MYALKKNSIHCSKYRLFSLVLYLTPLMAMPSSFSFLRWLGRRKAPSVPPEPTVQSPPPPPTLVMTKSSSSTSLSFHENNASTLHFTETVRFDSIGSLDGSDGASVPISSGAPPAFAPSSHHLHGTPTTSLTRPASRAVVAEATGQLRKRLLRRSRRILPLGVGGQPLPDHTFGYSRAAATVPSVTAAAVSVRLPPGLRRPFTTRRRQSVGPAAGPKPSRHSRMRSALCLHRAGATAQAPAPETVRKAVSPHACTATSDLDRLRCRAATLRQLRLRLRRLGAGHTQTRRRLGRRIVSLQWRLAHPSVTVATPKGAPKVPRRLRRPHKVWTRLSPISHATAASAPRCVAASARSASPSGGIPPAACKGPAATATHGSAVPVPHDTAVAATPSNNTVIAAAIAVSHGTAAISPIPRRRPRRPKKRRFPRHRRHPCTPPTNPSPTSPMDTAALTHVAPLTTAHLPSPTAVQLSPSQAAPPFTAPDSTAAASDSGLGVAPRDTPATSGTAATISRGAAAAGTVGTRVSFATTPDQWYYDPAGQDIFGTPTLSACHGLQARGMQTDADDPVGGEHPATPASAAAAIAPVAGSHRPTYATVSARARRGAVVSTTLNRLPMPATGQVAVQPRRFGVHTDVLPGFSVLLVATHTGARRLTETLLPIERSKMQESMQRVDEGPITHLLLASTAERALEIATLINTLAEELGLRALAAPAEADDNPVDATWIKIRPAFDRIPTAAGTAYRTVIASSGLPDQAWPAALYRELLAGRAILPQGAQLSVLDPKPLLRVLVPHARYMMFVATLTRLRVSALAHTPPAMWHVSFRMEDEGDSLGLHVAISTLPDVLGEICPQYTSLSSPSVRHAAGQPPMVLVSFQAPSSWLPPSDCTSSFVIGTAIVSLHPPTVSPGMATTVASTARPTRSRTPFARDSVQMEATPAGKRTRRSTTADPSRPTHAASAESTDGYRPARGTNGRRGRSVGRQLNSTGGGPHTAASPGQTQNNPSTAGAADSPPDTGAATLGSSSAPSASSTSLGLSGTSYETHSVERNNDGYCLAIALLGALGRPNSTRDARQLHTQAFGSTAPRTCTGSDVCRMADILETTVILCRPDHFATVFEHGCTTDRAGQQAVRITSTPDGGHAYVADGDAGRRFPLPSGAHLYTRGPPPTPDDGLRLRGVCPKCNLDHCSCSTSTYCLQCQATPCRCEAVPAPADNIPTYVAYTSGAGSHMETGPDCPNCWAVICDCDRSPSAGNAREEALVPTLPDTLLPTSSSNGRGGSSTGSGSGRSATCIEVQAGGGPMQPPPAPPGGRTPVVCHCCHAVGFMARACGTTHTCRKGTCQTKANSPASRAEAGASRTTDRLSDEAKIAGGQAQASRAAQAAAALAIRARQAAEVQVSSDDDDLDRPPPATTGAQNAARAKLAQARAPPLSVGTRALALCRSSTLHLPRGVCARRRFALLLTRWAEDDLWNMGPENGRHLILEGAPPPASLVGPALVLPSPVTAAEMHARMDLADRSEWGLLERLVDEQLQRAPPPPRLPAATRVQRRAERLMGEMAISRAIRTLGTDAEVGQAALTSQQTRTTLAALHPALDGSPAVPELAPQQAVAVFHPNLPLPATEKLIDEVGPPKPSPPSTTQRALTRPRREDGTPLEWVAVAAPALIGRGRMAAPGPSGLRAEHIREALTVKDTSAALKRTLAALAAEFCAGHVPPAYRDVRLFPIPKDNDLSTPRPVGACEALRKVACQLVARAIRPTLQAFCEPAAQLGMSLDGTLRAAMRVRRRYLAGSHVVAIDLVNAFNSVFRQAILDAVPQGAPGMELIETLYHPDHAYRARLAGQGWAVPAVRGVVQGCPLAPMLFATATVPIIKAVRQSMATVPLSHDMSTEPDTAPLACVWFADDGHVTSSSLTSLAGYVTQVQERFARVGLRLNTLKTLSLTHGNPQIPAALAARSKPAPDDVLKCLGVPIGDREACTALLCRKVAKATRQVQSFSKLRNPAHVVQCLSLGGMWTRLEYIYSSNDLDAIPDSAAAAGELVDLETLRAALGSYGEAFDGVAWAQSTLPRRLGGLAIRGCALEATTCRGQALERINALDTGGPEAAAEVRAAHRDARKERDNSFYRDDFLPRLDPHDTARMAELGAESGAAMQWLAQPLPHSVLASPVEAAGAVAIILGLEVLPIPPPPAPPTLCPGGCAPLPSTDLPDIITARATHMLGCPLIRSTRHNQAYKGFAFSLGSHHPGLQRVLEGHVDSRGRVRRGPHPTTNERPIDLAIARRETSWITTDFRCNSVRPDILPRIAADPLATAEQARREKIQMSTASAQEIREGGHLYHAIGLGPYGGIARKSRSALRSMVRATLADAQCTTVANSPDLTATALAAVSRATVLAAAGGIPPLRERLLLPAWKPVPLRWEPGQRNAVVAGLPLGRTFDSQQIIDGGSLPLAAIMGG